MSTDPNSPRVIADNLTEQEAAVMVGYLEEHGITPRTWGTQLVSVFGKVGPRECVQIVVKQSEMEQARQALEEIRQSHATSPAQ